MQNLLLIEDDVRLAQMVADYLRSSGFAVAHCGDAASGLAHIRREEVDLLVLDLMLAGAAAKLPIVMLTAKGDPMDRVIGLELGADDYVAKPFEPRELLARIRAVLRRGGEAVSEGHLLRFGSLVIDRDARSAHVAGKHCDLTSYQFDLLLVLSRDQIMEAVRGRELEAFDRSIDVHMGRIRSAIESDVKDPKRILTVRGVGYVFAKAQD
jgi:DNA-binding response OmpR family regulator